MGGEQELIERIANLEKLVETLTIRVTENETRIEKIDGELHNPVKIDGGFDSEIYRPIKLYGTVGERTDHQQIPATVGSVAVAEGAKTITLTCDFKSASRSGLYGTPVTISRPTTQGEWKKSDQIKQTKQQVINSLNNLEYGIDNRSLCTLDKLVNDKSHYFVTPTPYKQ